MDDKLATTIGIAAKAARTSSGMTQEDAAERIGVSPEFYARIERGKTLPSVPTLAKMVAQLSVSADVLLGLGVGSGRRATPSLAQPEIEDSATRQLYRRLRRGRPSTIRLVNLLLREIETSTKAKPVGRPGTKRR